MKNLLTLLLLPALCTAQQRHCGTVTKVMDGDSFMLQLTDTTGILKIRLHAVDAPELKQAYGPEAKQFVIKALTGKRVCIDDMGEDSYRATFAIVYYGGKVLQEEMLRAGLGWYQNKYYGSETFNRAEWQAKDKKAGLWSTPNPTPPWKFRKENTTNSARKNARTNINPTPTKDFEPIDLTRSRPQKLKR